MRIAIGCSYTKNWKVKGEFPEWPEVLSKLVNDEVVNLGAPGSSCQYAYDCAIDAIHTENVTHVYWLLTEWDRITINFPQLTMLPFGHQSWDMNPEENYRSSEKFLEFVKSILTPEYIARNTLRLIYNLQEICESKNINLIIAQGFWHDYDHAPISEKEIANAMIKDPYFYKIKAKSDTLIGFPFTSTLGGYSIRGHIGEEAWRKNYTKSANDTHPGKTGHEKIAEYFMLS